MHVGTSEPAMGYPSTRHSYMEEDIDLGSMP